MYVYFVVVFKQTVVEKMHLSNSLEFKIHGKRTNGNCF